MPASSFSRLFYRDRAARRRFPGRCLRFETLESRRMLANYYVDPAGLGGVPNDDNTGTISHPLATIAEAMDRVQPGDTVYLRGGTYDEANGNGPIGFDKAGLPGEPITIRNYPGEQPIIDLGEYVTWQTNAEGWYYANVSGETAVTEYPGGVTVQIVGGWTATPISGPSYQGGPPQDFQQPPASLLQNGQLAYDLSWYDTATGILWFRSNAIQPVTAPDTQCAIVSAYSQFHMDSGAWVTIEGLQIQDGYDGLHIESTDGAVVEDCRILSCSEQGILGGGNDSQIADNYVDYIGGNLVKQNGTYGYDQLEHCLYFSGNGSSIYDNFFGQSYSGYSAQIITDAGPATIIADNVMYGSYLDGMTLYAGSDAIVTGNVFITHQKLWRGTLLPLNYTAMRSYYAGPDVTISGNYVESSYVGFGLYSTYGDATIPGMVVVGNTLVGGQYAGQIDGIPQIMNANQWGGDPFMIDLDQKVSYATFLAWAQSLGFQSQSTYGAASLIDPFTYDAELTSTTPLATALDLLRQYAAAQIDSIAGLPADTPTTIGGTSTPNAEDITPVAGNVSYSLAEGTTLAVASAQSILASDSDADSQVTSLAVSVFSGPTHGVLTLNSDGTFTYTPAAGFYGTDQFVYLVSDGRGGTAQATVTLQVNGALAAAAESYSLASTGQLTVLAPGVLTADSLPVGQSVTVTASQAEYGTLTMNSDGSFTYVPESGFTGTDSFQYTVTLAGGATASNTVTLTVTGALPGQIAAGPDGDMIRLWQSADGSGTLNALDDSQGDVTTYSFAPSTFTQWIVTGGADNDILRVDYGNGDPLPSGGLSYNGGGYVAASTSVALSGNQLDLTDLGSYIGQNIEAVPGEITLDGKRIVYSNVQAIALGRTGVGNFNLSPEFTILYADDDLVYAGNVGYIGDLKVGQGAIDLEGQATVGNVWVEDAGQLAGDGSMNFTSSGDDMEGAADGLYFVSATTAFAGSINGPGIVELYTSQITLSGTNTFSGGIVVNSGTLVFSSASALPSGSNLTIGTAADFTANSNMAAASAPAMPSAAVIASAAGVSTAADPFATIAQTMVAAPPTSTSSTAVAKLATVSTPATATHSTAGQERGGGIARVSSASAALASARAADRTAGSRASTVSQRAVDQVLAAGDWRNASAWVWTADYERRDRALPAFDAVLYDAQGRPVFRGPK